MSDRSAADPPVRGLIPRPPFQLRSLPIALRWEVTRRHPYYQTLWEAARKHHRGEPLSGNPAEPFLRQAAVAGLAMIGVSGEPPIPATPFAELGVAALNQAWLSGAVHPISLRGMAAVLLASLPKDTLGTLGMLFLQAGCDDVEGDVPRVIASMMTLQSSEKAGLDSHPDEPFVSVNPAASVRQVNEAVSALLSEWKQQRELSEQRDRSDKYPGYVDVWDRREGWGGGGYDLARERTLQQIAQEIGEPLSTVNNHYRRAFQLIVGHSYSPSLWWRTMGSHKILEFGFADSIVSRRRPMASPSRRPVPEAVLGADVEAVGRPDSDSSTAYSMDDFMIDLRTLVAEGRSDEEIIRILELPPDDPEWREVLGWIRRRAEDQ